MVLCLSLSYDTTIFAINVCKCYTLYIVLDLWLIEIQESDQANLRQR